MINWFSKFTSGLKKTSDKVGSGISDIFTKRHVDSASLDELEEILLEADLGYQATSNIIQQFSAQKFSKDSSPEDIKRALATNIAAILRPCEQEFVISAAKPHVILMVGVNGAGKTTTTGKMARKFKDKKISLIAGDTFRAAAVEQLKVWGERNDVRVYSASPGADAAGLCFDGLSEAIKQGDDIVFIDTAGRLQNKTNLTDELKKIIRVIQKVVPDAPHHTLLCLDATTGQNAVDQAQIFKNIANVNGLVVNKLDGSAKGGVLVAIAEATHLPIYYIGLGEGIDDLKNFAADEFALALVGL